MSAAIQTQVQYLLQVLERRVGCIDLVCKQGGRQSRPLPNRGFLQDLVDDQTRTPTDIPDRVKPWLQANVAKAEREGAYATVPLPIESDEQTSGP